MRVEELVKLFEKVQRIPYKVCKFEEQAVDENLRCGDCRHKSLLLYNLLKEKGFNVKKTKVVFNWADLPLPQNVLSILKVGTLWDHSCLSVNVRGGWFKVDCSWDVPLEKLGFPVTKNWDGFSDTNQITNGLLEFYDADRYQRDQDKIKIVKEEAYEFAESLNKLLEGVR